VLLLKLNLFIYRLFINFYFSTISLIGIFHSKAHKFSEGRRNFFHQLKADFSKDNYVIWFHAASLGEFEQGRPIIELIKNNHPEVKILLSFFSPSGYEQRKNYQFADRVCYLPADNPSHASKFVAVFHPDLAVFIKYEIWYYYFKELKCKNIPLIMISSVFRNNQILFKPWAPMFKATLQCVHHFFVQNEESVTLLKQIGFSNTTLAPDSRIDRVNQISGEPLDNSFDSIKTFTDGQLCLIAGSSYITEEKYIASFLKTNHFEGKVIIAPHHVSENRIHEIEKLFPGISVRWSLISDSRLLKSSKILIIDTIGLLSRIYKFGDIAFIGGGFNNGIHNTLEPAAYGLPVIFGPKNFHKFPEACQMLKLQAAFKIRTRQEFNSTLNLLLDESKRKMAGKMARSFIDNNLGGSFPIFNYLQKYFLT